MAVAWEWLVARRWVAFAAVVAGIGVRAFLELAESLSAGNLLPLDLALQEMLRPYHTPALDRLAGLLSALVLWPEVAALVAPFLLYLLLTRRFALAWALVIIPLGTVLVVDLLKVLFHRQRPITMLVTELGGSFPSGHATGAMVLYGLLGFVAWRYWTRRRWARILIAVLTGIMILATGLARIYLEVHYPSDVLAGWAAGAFLLFGSLLLLAGAGLLPPGANPTPAGSGG